MTAKRIYNSPTHRIHAWGGHMLRSGFRKTGNGSLSLVGLGVFKPRGELGDGCCCAPECLSDTDLWASWLSNGEIIVLPFCQMHAKALLLVNETEVAYSEHHRPRRTAFTHDVPVLLADPEEKPS